MPGQEGGREMPGHERGIEMPGHERYQAMSCIPKLCGHMADQLLLSCFTPHSQLPSAPLHGLVQALSSLCSIEGSNKQGEHLAPLLAAFLKVTCTPKKITHR